MLHQCIHNLQVIIIITIFDFVMLLHWPSSTRKKVLNFFYVVVICFKMYINKAILKKVFPKFQKYWKKIISKWILLFWEIFLHNFVTKRWCNLAPFVSTIMLRDLSHIGWAHAQLKRANGGLEQQPPRLPLLKHLGVDVEPHGCGWEPRLQQSLLPPKLKKYNNRV